jgi:hypothetical protein
MDNVQKHNIWKLIACLFLTYLTPVFCKCVTMLLIIQVRDGLITYTFCFQPEVESEPDSELLFLGLNGCLQHQSHPSRCLCLSCWQQKVRTRGDHNDSIMPIQRVAYIYNTNAYFGFWSQTRRLLKLFQSLPLIWLLKCLQKHQKANIRLGKLQNENLHSLFYESDSHHIQIRS